MVALALPWLKVEDWHDAPYYIDHVRTVQRRDRTRQPAADSSTIRGMAKRADYEAMTLGNMRQFGMTRLDVSCDGPDCWHRADVDVSRHGDDVIVAELGWRFFCSQCGSRTVDARPDWRPGEAT
jgi:hypothetical protein